MSPPKLIDENPVKPGLTMIALNYTNRLYNQDAMLPGKMKLCKALNYRATIYYNDRVMIAATTHGKGYPRATTPAREKGHW